LSARFDLSSGTWSAPSPETSTLRRPRRAGVAVTMSYRDTAMNSVVRS